MLILIGIDILDMELDLIGMDIFHFLSLRQKCNNFWSRHEFINKDDNRKEDILILGKGPTQGLEHALSAEEMYSTNFTVTGKNTCLSLHYNGANSYLFVNGTEIHKFKAKDSEIVATPLCLGNISKDWSVDNTKKKTGLNGYVYDFSVLL